MIGRAGDIISWLQMQDQDQIYEIDVYRDKRSLNANRYCWKLIVKIADVLRTSKEDVYLDMLRKYGQSEMISVRSDINIAGFVKYFDPVATVTLQGKRFTHYKVYKGSSEYDTREMSILIDGVIYEAENLDIETLPPHEIERLKGLWNG